MNGGRPARQARPSATPATGPAPAAGSRQRVGECRQLRLHDGRKVGIRPIRPGDADAALDLYGRLSTESRRSRFFTAGNSKRRVDAVRLAGAAGRFDWVLVAVLPAAPSATDVRRPAEEIVAVAQLADYGEGAEAALVVRDDYQGVGLGTALFDQLLADGARRGIANVDATVLSGNNRILRILRHHRARLGPSENGVLQATIPAMSPSGAQPPGPPRTAALAS